MSQIPKRNGWTIAEHAGDATPDKIQRLLNRAVWDTVAAMGVVRRFAVAGLDEAARRSGRRRGLAVAVIDETGQVKQGQRTAGVKRHYLGCAGKVASGITTVHLAYVREQAGHALIAARQWIPAEQIDDPATSAAMGLPPGLVFATKGQLAVGLCAEVFADGIAVDFVCGDEVYGSCTQLRAFCEARGQGYVLRVPSDFCLTLARGVKLSCQQAAARLLAGPRRWEVRSAGKGSKGARWYARAWVATISPRHYLLIRRHRTTGELAFCYCYVPEDQVVSLSRLIRAAGLRWPVEENFQFSKDCFGLDQSQVRLYTPIARTPCWSPQPSRSAPSPPRCCAAAPPARHQRQSGQLPPANPGMIPLTIPETARLLTRPPPPGAAGRWLDWRRRHQARSAWYHQRTRLARDNQIALAGRFLGARRGTASTVSGPGDDGSSRTRG